MRQKKQIFRAFQALTLSSVGCQSWTREEIIKSPTFSAIAIGSICGLTANISALAAAKILGISALTIIYLEKETVNFKTWLSYNAMILASQVLVAIIAYYSSFAKNLNKDGQGSAYVIPLVLGLQYLNPALLSFKYGLNSLDLQRDSLAIFADCIIAAISFISLIWIYQLLQLREPNSNVVQGTGQTIPSTSGNSNMQDLLTTLKTTGKEKEKRKESDQRRGHRSEHNSCRTRSVRFAPQDLMEQLEEGFVERTHSLRAKTPKPKDIPTIEEDIMPLDQPKDIPTIEEDIMPLDQPKDIPTIEEDIMPLDQPKDIPTIEEDIMPSRSLDPVSPPLHIYESGASSSSERPTPAHRPLLSGAPISPSMIGNVAQPEAVDFSCLPVSPKSTKKTVLKTGTDRSKPKTRK